MCIYDMAEVITGARRDELKKVLLSTLALFFLLLSYYFVKPMRNAAFLKEFNPELLPVFFLFVAFVSYCLTKVFNRFSLKLGKIKLLTITFLIVVLCKIAFFFLLLSPGKQAVEFFGLFAFSPEKIIIIVFFVWAAVYFLLSIALLWACINDMYTSSQGKRVYGFICVGAIAGAYLGAQMATFVIQSGLKQYVLLFSAASLLVSLVFMIAASRSTDQEKVEKKDEEFANDSSSEDKATSLWELVELWRRKYLRSIAVIVFSLAFFNTAFYFQSQKIIDREMTYSHYMEFFGELSKGTGSSVISDEEGFQFVFSLKELSSSGQRKEAIRKFLQNHSGLYDDVEQGVESFYNVYHSFRDKLDTSMNLFFANTFAYQNLLGALFLFLFSRVLFNFLGMRVAVLLLPTVCLIIGISLFFPLTLELVQFFMIFGSALNYSLNNATKELLYVPAGREANFRFKPLIEGPVMRIGDALTSALKIALTLVFGVVTYENIYLSIALLVVVIWFYHGWRISSVWKKHEAERASS